MEKRQTVEEILKSNYDFIHKDRDAQHKIDFYVYINNNEKDHFNILSVDTRLGEVAQITVERVKIGLDGDLQPALLWFDFNDKTWETFIDGADFEYFMHDYNNYLFDKEVEKVLNEQ